MCIRDRYNSVCHFEYLMWNKLALLYYACEFFFKHCELLWRHFFFLEAPCMETILIDFYFASIHCLWIMNKNSVKKNAWNFQDEKFGTFSSEILLILLLISSQILLSKTWCELIIAAERAIAFNQTALRYLLPECIVPRATRGCHTVEPFLMQHLKVCKSGRLIVTS